MYIVEMYSVWYSRFIADKVNIPGINKIVVTFKLIRT